MAGARAPYRERGGDAPEEGVSGKRGVGTWPVHERPIERGGRMHREVSEERGGVCVCSMLPPPEKRLGRAIEAGGPKGAAEI